MAEVLAVCLSQQQGEKKQPVAEGVLRRAWGLEGDAHAGEWHRQVSLLGEESISLLRSLGLEPEPGAFAENLTVRGIKLHTLPLGTRLRVGNEALLEVSQIGKECHHGCAIFQQVGDCVMPREGIFARVLTGGRVRAGDRVEVVEEDAHRLPDDK